MGERGRNGGAVRSIPDMGSGVRRHYARGRVLKRLGWGRHRADRGGPIREMGRALTATYGVVLAFYVA